MTLRVTVEIVPYGVEEEKYTIRQLDIFNKGRVDLSRCEYGVIDINPEKEEYGLHEKEIIHRRDLGAMQLIKKAVEELEL